MILILCCANSPQAVQNTLAALRAVVVSGNVHYCDPSAPSLPAQAPPLPFERISHAIHHKQYTDALCLTEQGLLYSPHNVDLLIRKAVCIFMLDGAGLEEVCASLPSDNVWGVFFSACLPLLQKDNIDFKRLLNTLCMTNDLVFKIFALRMLEVHFPAIKYQYEFRNSSGALEVLTKQYRQPFEIFSLGFLEQIVQRSIQYINR